MMKLTTIPNNIIFTGNRLLKTANYRSLASNKKSQLRHGNPAAQKLHVTSIARESRNTSRRTKH